MISAPTRVPPSEPSPPIRLVPPITDRGNRVELVHHAGDRLRGVEPRGQHDRGDGAHHAGHAVDRRLVKPHGDAGQARRLLVAADRVDIAAEGGARQHEMRHGVDQQHHDHRRRHEPGVAGRQPAKALVEPGDRPAFGHDQRRAARHAHHAERDDERRQSAEADQRAVEQAAAQADGQRAGNRDHRRLPALQQHAEHDAGERHDRPDRQIDAAGDDHVGQADRDDRVDAGLLDDVEQVRDREEVRRQRPQHRAQRQQADQRAETARPHPSTPTAARRRPRRSGRSGQVPTTQRRAQDLLLRRRLRIELVLDAPAAHHQDAIAHAEQLRQLRRDHDDRRA